MTGPGTIHRASIFNNRPKRDKSASILEHPATGDHPYQDPLRAQPLLQLRDDVDEVLSGPGTKQPLSSFPRTMDGGNYAHRLYA